MNKRSLLKRMWVILLSLMLIVGILPMGAFAAGEGNELKLLFTHDIHDYFYPTVTAGEEGELLEHGGAARLASIIKEHSDENTVYLDGGDFSMGTLYQAAYSTDAVELRNLGAAGCTVTTFGNHEFDYGAAGIADMLEAAASSGDELPLIVQSNIDLSGELTDDRAAFRQAMEDYGVQSHVILDRAGYKIGIFGLVGYDCIECIQTELSYIDYIEAAAEEVMQLQDEGCDLIIALSHAGTNGDGATGEDIDLATEVDGIDVIISGHTHTLYNEPVLINDTVIVSCGEYLSNVGELTLVKENGSLTVTGYDVIPVDSSVEEDAKVADFQNEIKAIIESDYLEGRQTFDQIIAHSSGDMISLSQMYATHEEYTTGDLIADSYIYEAEKNGVTDIDVALVGLGTIRGSIRKGDVSLADAFEICSLGVGGDGSAGHPIVVAYVTGKELKLVTELDASLGNMVSSIKMSYSGLEFTFNNRKLILDRVTDVYLVDKDGNREKIEDKKLYKVAANMYAINMLGMLNGLTRGILSITPKDENGVPIEDFYTSTLQDVNGNEVKEWVAFADYLQSFDKGSDGVSEIPDEYYSPQGRKNMVDEGGIKALFPIGTAAKVMPVVIGILLLVLILIVLLIIMLAKRRKMKRRAAENNTEEYPDKGIEASQSATGEVEDRLLSGTDKEASDETPGSETINVDNTSEGILERSNITENLEVTAENESGKGEDNEQ